MDNDNDGHNDNNESIAARWWGIPNFNYDLQ